MEEDDRFTRIQEHSNEYLEYLQPLEESLEEPIMNKEEFPIVVYVHEQSLVAVQARVREGFQLQVLTPPTEEY